MTLVFDIGSRMCLGKCGRRVERGYCTRCVSRIKRASTTDGVHTGSKPKLTESQCKEIKKMHASFKTNMFIAKHFGVNITTIRKVVQGKYSPLPDSQ